MLRRLAALVALLALVTGGLAGPAAPPAVAAGQRYLDPVFTDVTVTGDLVYGAAPDEHGRTQQLRLDLYQPTGDALAARPVVVLAHGGGFAAGSKADMRGMATALAQRGYVATSIEYRMHEAAGGISFPPGADDIARIFAAKHDMQAAVRWLRAHSSTHRLDPGRVAVGGSSAGGVMAVLVATTPDDPGSSGTPGVSSEVCTAVSLAGAGEPALVDPGDAGAIFFHGDRDTTVPYSQAVATHEAMAAAGLATELVTFPGVGHGLGNGEAILQRSSEWLHERLVVPPASCTGDPAHASFVRAVHRDFLGRDATEGEVATHAGQLDAGRSPTALLRTLTTSDEWLGRLVTGFYSDALGRAPDAAGLAFWVGELRSGRRTVPQVVAAFYGSPEHLARTGGTLAGWVGAVYEDLLGRVPGAGDVAYWSERARARGRTWVAAAVHDAPESRQLRVRALYDHLLSRSPDPGGLAFWADRVGREGDLALARSLAASPEYWGRAVARFP